MGNKSTQTAHRQFIEDEHEALFAAAWIGYQRYGRGFVFVWDDEITGPLTEVFPLRYQSAAELVGPEVLKEVPEYDPVSSAAVVIAGVNSVEFLLLSSELGPKSTYEAVVDGSIGCRLYLFASLQAGLCASRPHAPITTLGQCVFRETCLARSGCDARRLKSERAIGDRVGVILGCRVRADRTGGVVIPPHPRCPQCGSVYWELYALPCDDGYLVVSTTGTIDVKDFYAYKSLECACGYILHCPKSPTGSHWWGQQGEKGARQQLLAQECVHVPAVH